MGASLVHIDLRSRCGIGTSEAAALVLAGGCGSMSGTGYHRLVDDRGQRSAELNGTKRYLAEVIGGFGVRFVIPVYQRNYDWKPENCARLFDDLVETVKEGRKEHFFGSIVSQTPHGEHVIIDGQQRITTVFLLFAAMVKQLRDGKISSDNPNRAVMIEEGYLINKWNQSDQKLRLKLIKSDSVAFEAVLEDACPQDLTLPASTLIKDSTVTQNYLYFKDRLVSMPISVEELVSAIERLCVIDITLDPSDDAQLIFESLNSTGLDLSEADKIRNFVLMNLNPVQQDAYYDKYWNVIEKNTDYEVSDFIRFYLAAVEGKTPAMKKVYQTFRVFARRRYRAGEASELHIDTAALLGDMLTYSGHYRSCIHPDVSSGAIGRRLMGLRNLDASVVYPYLLNLLEYRRLGKIDDAAMAGVLGTVEVYVFRRWVCGVPSNALNKIFETLHGEAQKGVAAGGDYADVVTYLLTHKGGTGRFPGDAEFAEAVRTRDFYRIGNRKFYLYDRLENGDTKEHIDVIGGLADGNFSVEHVMPQTLSETWRSELGKDWEVVHERWLHRMANLTLTAYNSDYSNRPFAQKRDMEKGFSSSGFHMNNWIAEQDSWGERQLEERCERLVEKFLELWPMPESSYVPQQALFEQATLDSDVEFTGRCISAFSFMGERHAVKQWNAMLEMVVRLIKEREPAKVYSLVEGSEYPASHFRADAADGFTRAADGVFVKTWTSTSEKICLLRKVFEFCGIDESELSFEMPGEEVGEDDAPSSDGLSEVERVKLAYWTAYRTVAEGHPEFLAEFSPRKPSKNHWSDLSLGTSSYHIALLINVQTGRTGIELYMPKDKAIGHYAIKNKALFEERLGLAAVPFDAKKASGLRFYKDGHPIKGNEAAWPGYIEEQLGWALKMKSLIAEIGL